MKTFKLYILSSALFIFLAGCGGSNSKNSSTEGSFTGTFSDGTYLSALVLEDRSFWSIYGSSPDKLDGFDTGQIHFDDGKFTTTFTNFSIPGDKPQPGNGSGTFTANTIVGSITQGSQTLTFNTTTTPAKNYIYDTPASITSIVGPWSGTLLDGDDASIDILAEGAFSGSSSDGCHFTGQFDPTDVNVFNVLVTFGGTPCPFPTESATGIGVTRLQDDGKHQLIVAVVNSSKKAGTLFTATR